MFDRLKIQISPFSFVVNTDPSAGASDDWAYGGAGAEYSYTIELPPDDQSSYGFVLPESEIPGVVSTVWPGVKAMMKQIMDPTTPRNGKCGY